MGANFANDGIVLLHRAKNKNYRPKEDLSDALKYYYGIALSIIENDFHHFYLVFNTNENINREGIQLLAYPSEKVIMLSYEQNRVCGV